ncbi:MULTISPECIES: enoyl-CoA hydratase/isomerase family protein [unclassified Sphingopyxis]|uniref:enoyl-CoA hydratase/isomerase family protein n=1 Tax=unclassified Sphingopyxis TaxID=2614943 RepID=UPI00285A113D|nr:MULTISPECIES: enoyl-CoA hydratase/isomerase family protein [unclassified Sphingopyxis]MDR6833524.1 enoyl-CoA hydratase [Sphingopyxis sp. BE122]MDR7225793.1 enoyl-CoA hydratase [Sphingopyxis sp. BE259]
MTEDILISTDGRTGRLSLNRPKAIHALNLAMCEAMIDALLKWRDDDAVEAVIIDHSEGRGFCAGGDIRMLAESGAKDAVAARAFFHTEYRLNHLLFTYPKPVTAFMDGITMGGGVGISQPAKYRVATEHTRFAMPETGIGLFPDVGGGWYLPRLEGRVGVFLALTGARLDGAECLALGLATHYLPPEKLDEAKARIAAHPDRIGGILGDLAVTAPPADITQHIDKINRLFASDTYEDILAALEADGGDWAEKELAALHSKSPQTCKVALRQLKEGGEMHDFAAQMTQEHAIGSRVVAMHDFLEGVRALIVDKDNSPQWNPATPEAVTDDWIDAIFAPLPEAEKWTPLP